MAGGDENLHLLHDGGHDRLPSGIQFAHDIVQQHNGGFPPPLAVDLRLRQLQGKGKALFLSL